MARRLTAVGGAKGHDVGNVQRTDPKGPATRWINRVAKNVPWLTFVGIAPLVLWIKDDWDYDLASAAFFAAGSPNIVSAYMHGVWMWWDKIRPQPPGTLQVVSWTVALIWFGIAVVLQLADALTVDVPA